MSHDDTSNSNLPRRTLIKVAGAALVAVWSRKALPALAAQQPAGGPAAEKTMFLAPDGVTDAAVHSRVENLFWCDIMMEHAGFFATLMPGAELATQRSQAEGFQRSFQEQYNRAKTASLDRTNYAAFNRSTIDLMKLFIQFKQQMNAAQQNGKIRTLVFPSFFEHTAIEAERAAARLEKLAAGNAALEYGEVVAFWSGAMSDHSELIAHLLDPQEQELISQALDASGVFKGFQHGIQAQKLAAGQILIATEELIDFDTAVEEGVKTGRIKSILHPTLADHMRRETLKFVDELKRTSGRT
jgi:hypothetical protein